MTWYTDTLVKLPLFNSPNRVSSLDYLEPVTAAAIQNILADAKSQGIALMVFETYRSEARQKMLFQQHATQLEDVGVHGYGLAADLVKNINGEPSWKGDFSFLATLGQKYGLMSGLKWGAPTVRQTWVDACHLQRIRVMDQPKLFDNTWYPSTVYNPYTNFNA